MRTTQHSSREWGLARHNDRDFDITHADHIDPGKQNLIKVVDPLVKKKKPSRFLKM